MSETSPFFKSESPLQVSQKRILIVGCGYLGTQVARLARQRGDHTWATTRRREHADQLAREGIEPLIADWTDRRSLRGLPPVDRVLVAVSYDRRSGVSREDSLVGGLKNLLMEILPQQRVAPEPHDRLRVDPLGLALCYISTTGVYHQTDGRWVDETSPTHPSREGGQAHLRAEQSLHRMWPQGPWTILRLAGIYGPGRVPRAAEVIAGRPIASPESGHLNLIHVDDAARGVLACWDQIECGRDDEGSGLGGSGPRRRLYAIADDSPVVRGEFYREIARQSDAPMPRFCKSDGPSQAFTRSESDKRIWNRRMKRDLLPSLRFPSYRQGLAQILGR